MLSPSRTLPPQHRPTSRRSASSGSDLLQTKLRKLLNPDGTPIIIPGSTSTKDVLISPGKYHSTSSSNADRAPHIPGKYDTYHGKMPMLTAASAYMSMSSPKNYQQQLTVHPEAQSDVSVFFPSAFLSPQSLPPHPTADDDLYSFGIDDDDDDDDQLVLTDDYRAISPPAEYAENSSPKENSSNR